jgi:F-type H+-transporting ATPase subunit c
MNLLGLGILGVGVGIGLIIIGGGFGIGRIGASAMDGIARQPEAGNDIRTTAIILAALIEGATFFAIIMAYLVGTGLIGKIS